MHSGSARKTIPTRALAVAAFAAALLGAATASAQGQGAAAEALFNQGRDSMRAGDYEKACGFFRESSRVERTPGTLYNLADCEEKRGNLATAWQLFSEVIARLEPSDQRRKIGTERRDALAPRLPKVILKADGDLPESTMVRLGEVEFSRSSFGTELPVDPGKLTLLVTAEGHEPNELALDIAEGEVREVLVVVGPAREDAPAETTTDTPAQDEVSKEMPPPDVEKADSSQRTWGFISLGLGGAALAAGGVFGYLTLQKKSENEDNCDADSCNQDGLDAAQTGKTFGLLTTIGLAAGAVGVGAGLVLILTADSGGESVALRGRPVAGGAALDLRARF